MRSHLEFDDYMKDQLKDFEYACSFLQTSLEDAQEDGYFGGFLEALKLVVQVHGVSKIAKEAGISRDTVYSALSENGNPRLETLCSVLHSLGIKLSLAKSDQPVGQS